MAYLRRFTGIILKVFGIIFAVIVALFLLSLVLGFAKMALSKPDAEALKAYADTTYGKDFLIADEFIHTSTTQGSEPKPVECPAVELLDPDYGFSFTVYGWPFDLERWHYHCDYEYWALLYCMEQQGILPCDEHNRESRVRLTDMPCFMLENSEETAEKLQKAAIMYSAVCSAELYRNFYVHGASGETYGTFMQGGYVSDSRPDDVSGFYYDSSPEKYRAFLDGIFAQEPEERPG